MQRLLFAGYVVNRYFGGDGIQTRISLTSIAFHATRQGGNRAFRYSLFKILIRQKTDEAVGVSGCTTQKAVQVPFETEASG
jgi:hypothetical protein